jgi:hypothetical protein
MKYLFALFLVITLAFSQAMSSTQNIFEDHKLRSYSPTKAGVKDILFDIRMDGLLNNVKKTTSLTSLDDLYFRVYWTYPGQYLIVVEGLPKGFKMLRNNLKGIIKPFVDIIFSDDFIRQFERVPFVKDVNNKGTFVKRKQATDVNDIRVKFDNKGVLEAIVTSSPYTKVNTSFMHKLRSWSKGKFVMNKIKIEELSNGLISQKEIEIERTLQSGVGLPKSVVVEQSLKRKDKVINSSTQKFIFSNYHINTGKAARIMKGMKR